MKKLMFCGLVASLVCLSSGCRTRVPEEAPFAHNYQRKANAVEHWRQMATQLCAALATQQDAIKTKAIFLQVTNPAGSEFAQAYHKLLTAEMLSRSWKVVEASEQAQLQLSVEPQLVVHNRRDFVFNNTTIFGAVGHFVVQFFAGTGPDCLFCTEYTTRHDLLITAFVRDGGKLTGGGVQIVYIPGGDAELYDARLKLPPPSLTPPPPPEDSWAAVEATARLKE